MKSKYLVHIELESNKQATVKVKARSSEAAEKAAIVEVFGIRHQFNKNIELAREKINNTKLFVIED